MVIVLVIVLVLFGGSQLPKLAKNLGKAQKEFKDGIAEADKPATTGAPAAPQQVAPKVDGTPTPDVSSSSEVPPPASASPSPAT